MTHATNSPSRTLSARRMMPTNRRACPTLLLSIVVLFLTSPTTKVAAAGCSNQQAREQNSSTSLADCRAYEMVSPLDKNGGDISIPNERKSLGFTGVVQSTPDGTRITYHSLAAFGEHPGGLPVQSQYLAARDAGGWSTENITIPTTTASSPNNTSLPYKAFSTALTEGLLWNNAAGVEGEAFELDEAPIGGAPAGYLDYFVRNFASNTYTALLTARPPVDPTVFNIPKNLDVEGYAVTPDLRHVLVGSKVELVPGVTLGGSNLYEWAHGQLEPVNRLPGAGPAETAIRAELGSSGGYQSHTVSDDGSRVYWSIGQSAEALYLRENVGTPQARTVQVDASQGGAGSGHGLFLTASADGSTAFFMSHQRLTSDASTAADGNATGPSDLYKFDANSGHISDLTVDHSDPGGADVQGVLGSSEDGSYVYFVASGALSGAAEPGNCVEKNPATACNLYVWHATTGISFIARLNGGDEQKIENARNDWDEVFALRTARVSPDGHHVVFLSAAPLTGYDNAGMSEVYEYDFGAAGPICVSCNPSGVKPEGPSSIPGAVEYTTLSAVYAPRSLAADGSRVFFNSSDSLSKEDTNGKEDVYEWERRGVDGCEGASGCVSLISTGRASEQSTFVDASENGSDVFFTTRQELTPGDIDQQVDLYDARENGGYTSPNPPVCTGTGCQGLPSAPPIFATPPTFTFEGVGNFPAPVKRTASRTLTRAQKLSRALKVCAKKPRRQRPVCEKRARRRFGAVRKTTRK